MRSWLFVIAACGAAPAPAVIKQTTVDENAVEPAVVLGTLNVTCDQPGDCAMPTLQHPIGETRHVCGSDVALNQKSDDRCVILAQTSSATASAYLQIDTGTTCTMADGGATYHDRASLVKVECLGEVRRYTLHTTSPDAMTEITCKGTHCTRPSALSQPERHPGLHAFLQSVRRAVEHHEWREVLALASPEHKHEQLVEMKQDEATYIAELFGLHTVDNSLSDKQIEWTDLALISHLEIADIWDSENPDVIVVTGVVHWHRDLTLRMHLEVKSVNGHYVLTGAVG